MSVITNKWNDGSGDSINIESPSFQGNQIIKISSPVQKGTSKRSMKFIGKCKKDSSKQVILTVEQEASTYTYDLTLNSDNTEIAAKGGTATITAVLKTYRNGNLVSTDNVTPVLSGSATGFSISGTTVTASNRTTVVGAERSITVTGKFSDTFDGQTVSSTIVIKQSENYITSLKIGGGSTSKFLPPTITYSAAGGSNPFTGWVIYSSGKQANVDAWDNNNWVLPESYFTKSIANGILTVTGEYRGTTVGDKRTGVLTLRLNSVVTNNKMVETSLTLTQDANVKTDITYGNIYITYFIYPDIPASGGSVNPKLAYTQAKIQNYSSGGAKNIYTISSGATLTYGKRGTAGGGSINATTGVVSVGTRGTAVGNRWEIGEFFVIIKLNGKEGTATYIAFQAENKYTSVEIRHIKDYSSPRLSYEAKGGSDAYTALFTATSGASGIETTLVPYSAWSISSTDGFTMSPGSADNYWVNVNVASRGTTLGDVRTSILKITYQGVSSQITLTQAANTRKATGTSGGTLTYSNITAGAITNATIPAKGGSATATAGVGKQSWSKSEVKTTYTYDSGATKEEVTSPATSGINDVNPSIASINATASSKGTVVSNQTVVKSQVVTWSANGKSASGTMYIYQAANAIDSYNYGSWNIAISANPTTIAASGGTSTITSSCSRSKTPVYTSGSTGTATSESATPTLALTTNPGGFTLSGNKLTAANNPIGAKTAIVTASYSGATSKSVSVTQAAGPDGIGYMQIQGDGTKHPIFRVGGATRSVEPMSINETSETASDKDVSIFASIKKFLTKFV